MTISTKRSIKDFISKPPALFIAAPLILFSPLLIKGQALFWGTPSTQFIPWWDFAFSTILQGDLPLWNPWVGMGAPLLANYQTAIFYPPYWILLIVYAFLGISGMAWFITLIVVFHLSWSAVGTGKLLKEIGISELGQTVGGLAYALSGYLVARSGFLSINAAAAWLPWLLLFSYRQIFGKRNSIIPLSIVIALQLLAGHAQTAWYSILLLGLWSVFWIWKKGPAAGNKGSWLVDIGKLVCSGLLAVALSAIQLLPTLEYLVQSQRSGEYGFTQAMTYSFWPWRFLTLIVPNLYGTPAQSNYWGYGNYWEDAVYVGLMPLVFALAAIIKSLIRRKKSNQTLFSKHISLIRFLGLVTIISFVFALGKNTPIFPFLYRYVPTFDLFQAPSRFSILAMMSLALLAGIGVEFINKPTGRARYWSNLAAAGSFAITLGAGLGYLLLKDVKSTFFLPIAIAGLWSFLGTLLVLNKPQPDRVIGNENWKILFAVLVAADLVIAGWGLNPGIDLEFYQPEVESISLGRVWISPEVEYDLKYRDFFTFDSFDSTRVISEIFTIPLPNAGMISQQETVNNFDPLLPERYQEWMAFSASFADQPEHPVFDLMDASILLTENGYIWTDDQEIDNKRLMIANFAGYAEPKEILELIGDGQSISANDLLLENDQIGLNDCQDEGSGTVDILDQSQSAFSANLVLAENSWVLWSQTWYPGWNLILDGENLGPVLRGNYTFMAACIPAGDHIVEFRYQPFSVRLGAIISIASFSLIIGLALRKRDL